MPHVVTCAVNTNDMMCTSHDMCLSLVNYDAPENNYTPGFCVNQTTSTKINLFTFL